MKKKNYILPLSLDNIAKLLGKEDNITTEIEGIVMVKQYHTNPKIKESIKEQIFKNVLDEWKSDRSVIVGEQKLLTTVDVKDFEIKDQASSIENFVVMRVKATISIEQDPEYAKEISIEQDPEYAKEVKESKTIKLKM